MKILMWMHQSVLEIESNGVLEHIYIPRFNMRVCSTVQHNFKPHCRPHVTQQSERVTFTCPIKQKPIRTTFSHLVQT